MTKVQAHFGRRNAQTLGHRIGQRSFITLPRRTQAHRCIDPTRGLDADPRRLVARARNTGGLVELRAIGGGLHYIAQANAQPAALRAGMLLALAQRGVGQSSQHGLHGGDGRHVIQHLAGGHGVGQLFGLQHVDAAYRHRVQAQLARYRVERAVHHPAGHRHGRAHRGIAHLVGQHHLDVIGVVSNAVGPGDDHRHHTRQIVAGVEAVGTKVFGNLELQRQHPARAVHRHTGLAEVLARLCGRHEVLHPVFAPAHRPTQLDGSGSHRQFLAVQCDLLAKSPAHVGRHDCDFGLGQQQASRQRRAVWVRRLRADVKIQVFAPCIPVGDAATGLDRQVRLPVLRKG